MNRSSTAAIVIHTTASPETTTAQTVRNYFLSTLKWRFEGYHICYDRQGARHSWRDWRRHVSNGILPNSVMGYSNANTINLSYIGGLSKNGTPVCNILDSQIDMMFEDIEKILRWYPRAKIIGHNQINQTACPVFWLPDSVFAQEFPKNIDTRDLRGVKNEVLRYANTSNIYAKKQPQVAEAVNKELVKDAINLNKKLLSILEVLAAS